MSGKDKDTVWIPRLLLIGFLVVGVLFSGVGYYLSGWQRDFNARSIETTLQVLRIDSKQSRERDAAETGKEITLYRPVFQRKNDAGEWETYAGNLWNSHSPHKAGDTVPGRYDPKTGEMVSTEILGQMRGLGNIFYGLGAGMFLLALAVIWYRRRKSAPA